MVRRYDPFYNYNQGSEERISEEQGKRALLPHEVLGLGPRNIQDIADPPGVIKMFAGSSAPAGWLICDGSAISRSSYGRLYKVIGDRYGVSDDVDNFNLPNLQGRVPVGYDSSQTEFNELGETGGAKAHTLVTSEIPSHNHSVPVTLFGTDGIGSTYGTGAFTMGTAVRNTGNAGGGGAHNNLQPYLTVNFIIKY